MSYATWSAAVTNLEAWYRLGEGDPANSDTAYDSANSYDATWTIGNGANIDSATGLISGDSDGAVEWTAETAGNYWTIVAAAFSDAIEGTANLTFEFMVRDVSTANARCIVNRGGANNILIAFDDGAGSSDIRLKIFMNGAGNNFLASSSVNAYIDDNPHLWTLAYDGDLTADSRWKAYCDGDEIALTRSGTIPTTVEAGGGAIIGSLASAPMVGIMDEFKIYSDTKDQDHNLEAYNQAMGLVGNAIFFGSNF